jgi:hypothetical protein
MQYTINLAAGVKQTMEVRGRAFYLLSTGAASSLALTIWQRSRPVEELTAAQRGFKMRMVDGQQFDRLDLMASVACVVVLYVSDGAVDFDFVGTATNPIPISLGTVGTPGSPLSVTAVTVSDAPAISVADGLAVAVAAVAVQIVAAAATRRELRLANIGTDPCAIGAAGITWAKRCVILNPGDIWIENRGANLAWFAICDAAKSASVTAQEVLA